MESVFFFLTESTPTTFPHFISSPSLSFSLCLSLIVISNHYSAIQIARSDESKLPRSLHLCLEIWAFPGIDYRFFFVFVAVFPPFGCQENIGKWTWTVCFSGWFPVPNASVWFCFEDFLFLLVDGSLFCLVCNRRCIFVLDGGGMFDRMIGFASCLFC